MKIDPLTGLSSKPEWPAIVARTKAGAPVALLDLDHMKHFNMHNGSVRGDELLAKLGAFLRATVPQPRDIVRIGGQSFVVVWPAAAGADERARESCAAIATWVRTSLAPPQPAHCGDASCIGPAPLTVSIALTHVREVEDATALFARLDEALLGAKRAGRDRIVIA